MTNAEIMGILRGNVQASRDRGALVGVASGLLGFAIGIHVDLDMSDEGILQRCRDLLEQIRAAVQDPAVISDLGRLGSSIAGAKTTGS